MKSKKFFGVLVVLCLMLFVVGGVVTKEVFDTKLIAGVAGGVLESIHIIPLPF